MWHSRWHKFVNDLGVLSVFLLLFKVGSAPATSDSSSLNYNNYNGSIKQLRFHDFEPRQQLTRLVREGEEDAGEQEAGREARGFHFNASGQDVNVELEFIVPFVRVPVKRSIKLAREAVQSVLNLQKGALLNTAVIVVAGAIIAGIVRLVLAPIVFTSLANNYAGYVAKEYEESSKSMRSLTQVLESQLDEHNIDVSVCAQRAICQYLQHNAAQAHPQMILLILAGCVVIWAASEESEESSSNEANSSSSEAAKEQKQQQFKQHHHPPGVRLISFDTVDKDVAIGLDYLLPFVTVPVKRKRHEAPRPLVIVNSAAIFSCGLVAVGGIIVGHLIRSMGLETIVPDPKEDSAKKAARGLLDEQQNFLQIFDNFKLVYRNESGERVETGLTNLVDTIEHSLLDNDIDLPACLLKSLCTFTHKAARNVRSGQASDVELMLDGVTSWHWLLSWFEESAIREAVEAGRLSAPHYCNAKYPRCKWNSPDEKLLALLHNNVQFN
ncbi:uncharacterized protein LOC133837916 isoform X2 [Drosophila sulfurigaster albostrigata]|uniref:uncharacterized protein LOC133837916 isoform X2 n=1 Tax=Drosophila sulfurigaster albostrigata TaxID=89887 RepID=UPI002D21C92D|nr:uncharacterized protein LOC133837916 isoform X2 [Drosophila sulfurigaster albostrigata]